MNNITVITNLLIDSLEKDFGLHLDTDDEKIIEILNRRFYSPFFGEAIDDHFLRIRVFYL